MIRTLATAMLVVWVGLAEAAMFGLPWGADKTTVKARFEGAPPGEETPHALVYPLGAVADRLWKEGGFCPTAVCSGPGRTGDQVIFNFREDQLLATFVSFGYSFEMLGLKPETLGEQAMMSFARTELHQMIFEMSARYGAPEMFSETPMRSGSLAVAGTALFKGENGTMVHLVFGHDGGDLAGELKYQAPAETERGF